MTNKPLDSSQIKQIVKEAMEETLISLGFRIDEQAELQADMLHLRNLRIGCETTKAHILKVFLTVTIPASLYIAWEVLKKALKE